MDTQKEKKLKPCTPLSERCADRLEMEVKEECGASL